MNRLCRLIQDEKDQQKLSAYTTQLIVLLEPKERRLDKRDKNNPQNPTQPTGKD